MGLTITTSSSYFKMTVPPNTEYGYYNFGYYKNTLSYTVKLKSITLYLGTGNGEFTAGAKVSGDGKPFTLRLYTGSSSSGNYGEATISNSMSPTSGGYPTVANCVSYRFNFNNPVTVASGSSIQLWWETQDRTNSKVLCLDHNRGFASEEEATQIFTVTFNANGGSVSPASVEVNDGSTISTLPIPTRDNCVFHMWTTTLNGNTEVTSNTVIYSDTTIYAKWKYNIVYNMNGGSIDGDDSNDESSSSTSGTSDIVELKTHGLDYIIGSYYPEKSGSTFYGWNTSSTATSPSYVDGNTYSINSPLTLYAVYSTQIFTVNFTDGYSGTILKSQKVNYGQDATPPPNPTRKGYEFQKWIGDYTNVKANLTIKAYWGFTPIWIMTASGWKKYEPKE